MDENIIAYGDQIKNLGPEEIIRFFLLKFPGECIFSTNLGPEDQLLTWMISKTGLPVKVFTLDTGRLFQETYDLLDITRKKYGLDIEVYFPVADQVEKIVHERGINLFYESIENRKLCCSIRKVEPLKRALAGMKIWISGLRKDQSVTRKDLEKTEWDEVNRIIKVYPLLDWTSEAVWELIRTSNIPVNPLHDKGFASIGCLPCTRAIHPGEDERAGRWWWELPENKECGLHAKG